MDTRRLYNDLTEIRDRNDQFRMKIRDKANKDGDILKQVVWTVDKIEQVMFDISQGNY